MADVIDYLPFIDLGGPILVSDLQSDDGPNVIKIYNFKVAMSTSPTDVDQQVAKFIFNDVELLHPEAYQNLSDHLDRLLSGDLVVLILMNLKNVSYSNLVGYELDDEITHLQWEVKDIEKLRELFKSRTQLTN